MPPICVLRTGECGHYYYLNSVHAMQCFTGSVGSLWLLGKAYINRNGQFDFILFSSNFQCNIIAWLLVHRQPRTQYSVAAQGTPVVIVVNRGGCSDVWFEIATATVPTPARLRPGTQRLGPPPPNNNQQQPQQNHTKKKKNQRQHNSHLAATYQRQCQDGQ